MSPNATETRDLSEVIERDAISVSNALKVRFFPFAPVGSSGVSVRNQDGRELLDFTAAWAVANVGHGNPRVRQAVIDQLDRGASFGSASAVVEPAVRLAERLREIVPCTGESSVWFGHSGSDASECVARVVTRSTGRRRIISFIGSYHGSTDGSAGISGHSAPARLATNPFSVKLPYPDAYRPQLASSPRENETAILRYLDDQILSTVSPAEDTAAVIVEAIQSDGGVIAPSNDFFRGLEEIARRRSILLVFDEVKVGLGRSGDWFAFQSAGVTPDFVVLGKALGGGLPLSAVVGRRDLLDKEPAIAIFTLGGNAISCAAGLAVLDEIDANGLAAHALLMGVRLRQGLDQLKSRYDLIGDVRGRGLALGMELVTDRDSKASAARDTAKVCYRAAELGLLLFYVGLQSNVLEFTPPLSIQAHEVDRGVEILEAAIVDVLAGRVSDEALASYAGW